MKVHVDTENCDQQHSYLIEESADSIIKLRLEIPTIITSQSKKVLIDQLILSIQQELNNFEWIIVGSVLVDYVWYLNAVERQETDKVGDMDNISKPVRDSLCGPKGIMIDDSQIGGLYTYWQIRNDIVPDNIVIVTIKFNNDYTLPKRNLLFIQYSEAICLPINVDVTKVQDLIVAKILIKSRLKSRALADIVRDLGSNADNYLICSEFDFHRTRIKDFPVMSLQDFNRQCALAGINIKSMLKFFRMKR